MFTTYSAAAAQTTAGLQKWVLTGGAWKLAYTLTQGQTLGDRPIGYGLFGGRSNAQSVAVFQGVRSITASGYGSAFDDEPGFQPANAFDGDPATWQYHCGPRNARQPVGALGSAATCTASRS